MKAAIQKYVTNLESLGHKIMAVLKPDGSIDGLLWIYPEKRTPKNSTKNLLATYKMLGRDFSKNELGNSLVETDRI